MTFFTITFYNSPACILLNILSWKIWASKRAFRSRFLRLISNLQNTNLSKKGRRRAPLQSLTQTRTTRKVYKRICVVFFSFTEQKHSLLSLFNQRNIQMPQLTNIASCTTVNCNLLLSKPHPISLGFGEGIPTTDRSFDCSSTRSDDNLLAKTDGHCFFYTKWLCTQITWASTLSCSLVESLSLLLFSSLCIFCSRVLYLVVVFLLLTKSDGHDYS